MSGGKDEPDSITCPKVHSREDITRGLGGDHPSSERKTGNSHGVSLCGDWLAGWSDIGCTVPLCHCCFKPRDEVKIRASVSAHFRLWTYRGASAEHGLIAHDIAHQHSVNRRLRSKGQPDVDAIGLNC